MNLYSEIYGGPNFILGLGDNFYPSGVDSIDDRQFQTSWENIFLKHNKLRVPWHIILGNHDYMGIPEAQIKFTKSKRNPGGLWNLPSEYYTLSFQEHDFSIDLFGIDTNGCQGHVIRSHPHTPDLLRQEKVWLQEELARSNSTWKIVFGHHPLYTHGRGHSIPCICLRDEEYEYFKYHRVRREDVAVTERGYGFENLFVNGAVDLYISGHEHVFQHHSNHGLLHVVCGNSGADPRRGYGFYGGENTSQPIDWFDKTNTPGFVEFRVTSQCIVVNFISFEGHIFHSITKTKENNSVS
mmetsp:Transcript_14471/g.15147  ORF Transcript_14471/g.15147 Transcript_14471/m.15147 type:complete len:296 (-) Transcript_14471:98-985(-)